MKNSNDTIGNWTRGFPACSAVPQPTASTRTYPPPFQKKQYILYCVTKEWTNRGRQVSVATKFCMAAPNILESSVQNCLHVALQTPRTLRWILDFWHYIYQTVDLVNTVMKLRVHERQPISWPAERILHSQNVFFSMDIIYVPMCTCR